MNHIIAGFLKGSVAAGFLFVLLMFPFRLQAAVFTVNSTQDAVDDDPGNGACHTAADECTLRAAVMEANALPGADTINFADCGVNQCVYKLGIEGRNDDLALKGDLDIKDHLTITGQNMAKTVIDGGKGSLAEPDRVFDIMALPITVTITDVTIQNGDPMVTFESGGGVQIREGSTLSIKNSRLTTSNGYFGGAVSVDVGAHFSAQNVWMGSNTAKQSGAGLDIGNQADALLTGVEVMNNTAGDAGGGIANQGSLTIGQSNIHDNTSNSVGGGISTSSLNPVVIVDSMIRANKAKNSGGGIFIYRGNVDIQRSQIGPDNEAQNIDGGGIAVTSDQNTASNLTITNSTITTNRAASHGGGIMGREVNTTISLNNVTMAFNVANPGAGGGGLYVETGSKADIKNTVIAGNQDFSQTAPDCLSSAGAPGQLQTSDYNLIGNDKGCLFNNAGAHDIFNQDPLLNFLNPNGGTYSWSHALMQGSPAYNAGNNLTCPDHDQRGFPRARTGLNPCDIGSYEKDAVAPVCGNGKIEGAETCDDNNKDNNDGCSATCVIEDGWACQNEPSVCSTICGDNKVKGGENCDDGANNGAPNKCNAQCTGPTPSVCGNDIKEMNENCDDGANNGAPNMCNAQCTGITGSVCSNGVLEDGEECDDGNVSNEDTCLNSCTLPACGDGHIWKGIEECDDGNSIDGDGCSSACQIGNPPIQQAGSCGNGAVEAGEECDDGNQTDTDACRNTCAAAKCGDGVVQSGVETCDDGNALDGDACPANCVAPSSEPVGGDAPPTVGGGGGGGSPGAGDGSGSSAPEGGGGGCSLVASSDAGRPNTWLMMMALIYSSVVLLCRWKAFEKR